MSQVVRMGRWSGGLPELGDGPSETANNPGERGNAALRSVNTETERERHVR